MSHLQDIEYAAAIAWRTWQELQATGADQGVIRLAQDQAMMCKRLYEAERNRGMEHTVVTIRYEDGEVDTLVLSPDSPFGRAARGASEGKTITWQAPGGQMQATILKWSDSRLERKAA